MYGVERSLMFKACGSYKITWGDSRVSFSDVPYILSLRIIFPHRVCKVMSSVIDPLEIFRGNWQHSSELGVHIWRSALAMPFHSLFLPLGYFLLSSLSWRSEFRRNPNHYIFRQIRVFLNEGRSNETIIVVICEPPYRGRRAASWMLNPER